MGAGRDKSERETFCSKSFNTSSFFNHRNILLIPKINKRLKVKKNIYCMQGFSYIN